MRYKGNKRIKALIAAGLLAFNLSGCKREIDGYKVPTEKTAISENIKRDEAIDTTEVDTIALENFREKLERSFETFKVTLDKSSDQFVSSIVIDGTNVSIELIDGSDVSGTLDDLEMTDISFENFYIYDSQKMANEYNGYTEQVDLPLMVDADYDSHTEIKVAIVNCSVNNEYKQGCGANIGSYPDIDFSNCKSLWAEEWYLIEDLFSSMTNLETLVLVDPRLRYQDEEVIEIHSDSLKNIIIDGNDLHSYIDDFDFTGCPNLEVLSIPNDSQMTSLNGLKGLKNLKKLAFGVPNNSRYYVERQILNDFQNRIDLVSEPFPTDDPSLSYPISSFISDISGINGSEIEVLNVSFLKNVSSDSLLETVKSLPSLKQIVGFEVNNAGMCSDELVRYCEENGIEHPFTEKSLEIKHRLQEIVSSVVTEEMSEEEKIKALSEYIISNMEYDYDLFYDADKSPDQIKRGWGESLYYSVIEGKGVCEGYAMYAQNLFTEAGIVAYKIEGYGHTWNLVEMDGEYYFVDLTSVDGLINEEKSISFDDYDLDTYYLVPVDGEWKFSPRSLPVGAEEKYKESEEEIKEGKLEKIDLGNYMIQASRQNISKENYSEFCGIIGILCDLGLAKKLADKQEMFAKNSILARNSSPENKEQTIKVSSLQELLKKLKRIQKVEELRSKRSIAEREKTKNRKAHELENDVLSLGKESNVR